MAVSVDCLYPILPFLDKHNTEDDVHEMVAICLEVYYTEKKRNAEHIVKERISSYFKQRNQETNKLYNPWRNISIDQCFGESGMPVSEWINLTGWREWD